jgi:HAD superfamily hydrolase (TIGR01450 family)
VRFITNAPTHVAAYYAERLTRLGLPTSPQEVVPVASAALAYLRAQGPVEGMTAYVTGSPSLKAYLEEAGLRLLDGPAAERADAVVVGGHTDFDYNQLRTAGRAAVQARHFITCGRDAAFPMPDGPWPGAGAVVASIQFMAGRAAVNVGKPEPWLFETAAATLPPGGRIAMIGDNLESDIVGARRAGFATILVLTGHSSRQDLERSIIQPDYVVERLTDVVSGVD